LATLWSDTIEWPSPRPNLHIHLSPPCTELSNACAKTSPNLEKGLDGIRGALDFILQHHYTSWSLENVSTPTVRNVIQEYVDKAPQLISYTTVDAVDLGVPSTRRRLIAGPPKMIHRLRETPVRRISIAQAFRDAGVALPAQYIKNSTRTKSGRACVRSVHGPAHTVTASHPLTWCDADGLTIRCLNITDTSIIQGFPAEWFLPTGSRNGIRALGNAVCPPVAAAIMTAACNALGKDINSRRAP